MAEDDPDDRYLAAEALREAHSDDNPDDNLIFVEDGEKLLQYLRRQGDYAALPDTGLPDLILLDLNMPRMDGREALREIKRDPFLKQIPIVVFTTSQSDEDVERSYALGVNSFIVKPTSFDEMVRAFGTVIDYWFETCRLPGRGISTPS